MKMGLLVVLVWISLAALGCSVGSNIEAEPMPAGGVESLPVGDAARGQQIFRGQACQTCHEQVQVGPAIPGDPPLVERAASRRANLSAEAYLYESITQPNAYIVPGFQRDIMPGNFRQTLTDEQIADLIAYLMTMKQVQP